MFVRRAWPSLPIAQSEPARLLRDMERLFDAVWGPTMDDSSAGVYPTMNVTRDADRFFVRAELPGVDPKDLKISVERNKLSLAGRRTHEVERGVSYHRRERSAGVFNRTVTLPAECNADAVDARYVDGILTIILPLAEPAKARQISVKTT